MFVCKKVLFWRCFIWYCFALLHKCKLMCNRQTAFSRHVVRRYAVYWMASSYRVGHGLAICGRCGSNRWRWHIYNEMVEERSVLRGQDICWNNVECRLEWCFYGKKHQFCLIYVKSGVKMQLFWKFFFKTFARKGFLHYLCIRFRERTKPQAKRVKFVLRKR